MASVNDFERQSMGNICVNPLGDYNNAYNYMYLDGVSYNGGFYISLKDNLIGIAPTLNISDENWFCSSISGEASEDYIRMYQEVIQNAKKVESDKESVENDTQYVEQIKNDVSLIQSDVNRKASQISSDKEAVLNAKKSVDNSEANVTQMKEEVNQSVTEFSSVVNQSIQESITKIKNEADKYYLQKNEDVDIEIEESKNSAISLINQFGTENVNKIVSKSTEQINLISQEGEFQIQNVTNVGAENKNAINTISEQKIQEITDKGTEQVGLVTQEGNTQKGLVTQEGIKQVGLVQEAAEAITENADQIWKNELYSRHRATGIMLEANGTGDVEIQDGTDSKMEIEIDGKTEQVETTGAQLFDASKLPSKTQGGATVTNNGDGSFTISGSGAINGELNIKYQYTHEETVKLIKSGNLNIKIGKTIMPYVYIQFRNLQNDILFELNSLNAEEKTIKITEEIVKTDGLYMLIGFYAGIGKTIIPATIKPMLYQDGDGTWEPYTGGSPAPSPDYPQVIKGVGGMGYFDGEWRQGNISSTGAIGTETTGITSANAIPCKQNDNIAVAYEDSIDAIAVAFYNASGAYISTSTSGNNVDTFTATAPANAASFKVNLRVVSGSTIAPNGAKYCTVTINGEYQTGLETQGRNLAEVTRMNKSQTSNGVTFKLNDDGSYTLNGTCTGNTVFLLNQPDGSDIPNFPVICKLKAGTKYRITGSQIAIRNSTFPNGTSSGLNAMNNDIFYTPTEDTDVVGIRSFIMQGTTYSSTKTYYPGIWEDPGETLTEWAPFKRTSITIPLTSPLYDGDKICYVKPGESYVDADGTTVIADRILYGVYRENATVVFDGSEDEEWDVQTTQHDDKIKSFYILLSNGAVGYKRKVKCNKFKSVESNFGLNNDGTNINVCSFNRSGENLIFDVSNEISTNVGQWKTWLSENKPEVIYELVQPYFEPFVDQTEIYNLFTIDSYTRVASKEKETIPDLKVEYITDTKKYIDKKVSEAITQAITIAQV